MNDPHVTALHYWVNHDDSVDYTDADPLQYEHELFHLEANGRNVLVKPKDHYASEEEARTALEGFIRYWEFEAALDFGSNRFSLSYMGRDVADRNPPPSLPGTVQVRATIRSGPSTVSARVRVREKTYPSIPSGKPINADVPVAQAMLSQLELYHKGRALLAPMAYFCLTALEGSVPQDVEGTNADQRAREYLAISRTVLQKVRNLSSSKGGSEARKGNAVGEDFTKEERSFLLAAVQAFIRRAAERATWPDSVLPKITMANLPAIHD